MSAPAVRELFSLLDGQLTTTGLRLTDPNLPYEEFETICFVLGKMHEAVRFAIGDAIIFGEQVYAEEAFQAFESLCLSEEAMREYVRVASRVSRSTRRKTLSWSHHRAVAALAPLEQIKWLKKAVDESMSHHALRDALRGSPVTPAPGRAPCRCCGRTYE